MSHIIAFLIIIIVAAVIVAVLGVGMTHDEVRRVLRWAWRIFVAVMFVVVALVVAVFFVRG